MLPCCHVTMLLCCHDMPSMIIPQNTKIALGQISITGERQADFAFSPPFGSIHRTYLIQKQEKEDLYMQFARPFTPHVWLAVLCVVITSALYIFLLDRWNPYRTAVADHVRFTPHESIWYSYLTMCHLSAPFAAKILPIRIFSIFYWFFSMIVVGSYTGNLASSLTDAYFLRPSITSDIRQLPKSGFRFGCVAHSSTSDELKSISTPSGESLYDLIASRGDFVSSYAEGVTNVIDNKYILIGTSGVLSHYRSKYITHTHYPL